MVDVFSKDVRSKVMSRIRSKNTEAELILKTALVGTRIRYQPKMIGRPDFALKAKKIAVFVDGCFWHKCPVCFIPPKSNLKYWNAKIKRNVERDKEITRILKRKGWKVIRFWEHQIYGNPEKCNARIRQYLNANS